MDKITRRPSKRFKITYPGIAHPTAGFTPWSHRRLGRILVSVFLVIVSAWGANRAAANVPGGGTGSGPDVTVKDNGDGTVTVGNGIVSIVIVKASSRLNSMTYTYNNNGAVRTTEMLLGKGQYYYGGFMLGNQTYTYSLAADPTSNGGNYADVKLVSDTADNGVMETHFSMLRGSQGFYSTGIMTHRKQDGPFGVTAWGVVTRAPGIFNWLSGDSMRNFMIGVPSSKGVQVPNSPHEITVNFDGSQAGEYADKFIYGQDHADLRAWGWSSVGPGGSNIGIWMMTNMDFSNGGPMKRDVSVYPYSNLNNSILTGELGMGSDGNFAQGEEWTKTAGPWFIYVNNVPTSITGANEAAQALFTDAKAQAEAEKRAWPYVWFKNPNYAQASGRGMVTGKMVIKDPGNPNASAANLWVGLEQQPQTSHNTYDFQKWLKPYQYWVETDASGNFTIPNVLAGTNYTLWAYGPGGPGTFLSQNQQGGNPPLVCDVPATPFAVTVPPGAATNLGTVTWTPMRVGSTVFELGFPDRKADEFRHGEDYWSPDMSPKMGYPTPVWGAQMEFPIDFPDGMNYRVGKSQWTTDWNYVMPSLPDMTGAYQPCSATITFNLAQAPASGATASIYLGLAGNSGDHVILNLNGAAIGGGPGVTATPNPITADGFQPSYSDDSSIHFGDHGPFCDERVTFPGSMLHAGQNTLAIIMNSPGLVNYLMIDYLRLELGGYVPPAPPGVIAFAGNGRNLVCWTVAPGACSYTILRSTVSGSGYVPIATNVLGPVCGSGQAITQYADTTATNGTEYYYAVQSVNPVGHSGDSPPSAGVTASASLSATAPAAPAGLAVASSGHHQVALAWETSPGTNYYNVWRTTEHKNGVGGVYPLRTILLGATVGAHYTDNSPTDGKIYGYYVEAANAAGTSGQSAAVIAVPLPAPPAIAPGSLAAKWSKGRRGAKGIALNWARVPGATGYVIYRSTEGDSSFRWPENFVVPLMETTYFDPEMVNSKSRGKPQKEVLNPGTDYYYQVTAVNAGGISPSATVHVSPE